MLLLLLLLAIIAINVKTDNFLEVTQFLGIAKVKLFPSAKTVSVSKSTAVTTMKHSKLYIFIKSQPFLFQPTKLLKKKSYDYRWIDGKQAAVSSVFYDAMVLHKLYYYFYYSLNIHLARVNLHDPGSRFLIG